MSFSRRWSRPGREAYCHYDTQNTKNKTSFQPTPTFHFIINTQKHKSRQSHFGMSERNSQTPSTRQTPFEARLKKALRLSSVPCCKNQLVRSSPRTGYRKLLRRADSYRRDPFRRRCIVCGPGDVGVGTGVVYKSRYVGLVHRRCDIRVEMVLLGGRYFLRLCWYFAGTSGSRHIFLCIVRF